MKDLSFTVPPEYSGAQVKNFLRRGCGVSAKLLSQCKKMQNGILKNGKPVWTADTAAEAAISFFRWMTIFRLWLISGTKENIPPSGEKMEGETVALAKARRIWWSAYLGAQW